MSSHVDDVLLSRLIDADLSLTTRAAVLKHLEECARCAARHDELVSAAAGLRVLPPAGWSEALTEGVLVALPSRRRRARAGVAAVLSAGVFALALLDMAPVIAAVVAVAGVFAAAATAVVPAPVAIGGVELVGGMLAIAILAPLLAYPLARWR